MQDIGVAHCPTVAGGLIVEMKLLLALAGVVATLVLAQPCEGTAPGNLRQLRRAMEGEVLGSRVGGWLSWTLSPCPSEQLPPRQWRHRSFRTA